MASDRLHPESINSIRQLVKLHGADVVDEAFREVVRQETRYISPTERRRQQLEARGLKGDGNDVVKTEDVRLGDVVHLHFPDEHKNRFNHCVVVNIEYKKEFDRTSGVKLVHLFRPYAHTSDFSTTAGLIPYLGFEHFSVNPGGKLVVVDAVRDEAR